MEDAKSFERWARNVRPDAQLVALEQCEVETVDLAKEALRERVWTLLETSGAVPIPPGAHDRIPNFYDAESAADRIATLPGWCHARAVNANPDKAQFPLRRGALMEGKLVYMAVPRLAQDRPFVLLDPAELQGSFDEASTSEGGVALGRLVDIRDMEPIDLIVCGTVAVNRQGARLGKGGGFSDLEVGDGARELDHPTGRLLEHGAQGRSSQGSERYETGPIEGYPWAPPTGYGLAPMTR